MDSYSDYDIKDSVDNLMPMSFGYNVSFIDIYIYIYLFITSKQIKLQSRF